MVTRASTHFKVACAFLITSVLFYWKVVLTRQFSFLTGYEGVNQAYSWYQFIISSFRSWSWPAWDPFVYSGRSFLGETQTGAFYPANFLLALIPFSQNHLFSPTAYHIYVAVTHAFAGYLMFRLSKELGLGDFPGFVAGMAFSFSGMLQADVGWPHLLQGGIWLPAIFEYLLKSWRENRLARSLTLAGTGGVCLGLTILAGGLHFAIMDGIAALAAATYFWIVDRKQRGKIAIAVLALLITGLAVSAIQLLPSMEYSQRADRFFSGVSMLGSETIPYAQMESDHLWPYGFVFLLFANGFDGNGGQGEVLSSYIGVFPLLLAILGIWMARANRWARYFTGLALAAFLYSMGSLSPLHGIAYALIPKIWLAREASRFMYLADFALAALAAFGANALFTKVTEDSAWRKPTRAVNWSAGLAGLALLIPAIFGHPELRLWVAMSLILILLSALLYRIVLAGHTGTGVKFLVAGLIFFDLNAFDWSAANKIDMAKENQTNEMDRLLSLRGAADFLKARPGPFRVNPEFERAPNFGDAFQIESTLGAGVTMVREYNGIRARPDLLNAKYTLKPASAGAPGPVWQDSAWKIYENASAYPRAWMVHEVVLETDRSKVLQALTEQRLDLHLVALVSEPLAEVAKAASNPDSERVTLNHYDAARPDIAVVATSPGLLVLSENYYPGWTATVNGNSVKIVEVDGGLRGVTVPAGTSLISMRYRPASVIVGAVLCLSALVMVILGWFFTREPTLV